MGDEPNVFLYNVDDLRQIVDENLERRRDALPRAERVIAGPGLSGVDGVPGGGGSGGSAPTGTSAGGRSWSGPGAPSPT